MRDLRDLRQRLIDLGMTGYVEQQQVIDEIRGWLEENRKHWKGNNLCAHSEFDTVDWAIDELIEDLTCPSNANQKSKKVLGEDWEKDDYPTKFSNLSDRNQTSDDSTFEQADKLRNRQEVDS